MSAQRQRLSETPVRARAPAALAPPRPALTPEPVAAARAVQERLGNRGLLAALSRDAARQDGGGAPGTAGTLTVTSARDPSEREATATAAAVMRMAEPPAATRSGPAVQRAPAPAAAASAGGGQAPRAVADGIAAKLQGGTALAGPVRAFMEPRFGADFGGVRIHTGQDAAVLSAALGARAFTIGNHIFFGRDQYHPDRPDGQELIAHELTHTLQQAGGARRPAMRRAVMREEGASDSLLGLSPDGLARMAVGAAAPGLQPLLGAAGGLTAWLETQATGAFEAAFTAITGPAKGRMGIGGELAGTFGPLVATLRTAAGQIAQNDCTPIRLAAEKIEKTAEAIITPLVERLQPVVAAVREMLDALWEKIGSPIWNWIKQYAAAQWQMIKDIAELVQKAAAWLWDKTSAIRAVYVAAWKWLKDGLGIGDGPEGQNGVLQWLQNKLGEIWERLKAKLAPFTNQLKAIGASVAAVLLALSPAGPVMAAAGAVAGAAQGLRWMAANWGKGTIIVAARAYIETSLVPSLVGAARALGAAIASAAHAVSAALNRFAAGLAGLAGLDGPLVGLLVMGLQWLAQQATALAAFADAQLAQAQTWLTTALDRLQDFLTAVGHFLSRVADVAIDIWGLPVLLGEAIWDRMPACVRDPIVDFLGPIILGQIELFQELVRDDKAWQATKKDVGKIIQLVFHDHDLMGAVRATFALILRVFNLPPEMLATVAAKAEAAWDVVVKQPLAFIKNAVRALARGFQLLWADKINNLKLGLQGWLLGEVKEKNIVVPQKWDDPGQVFDFVCSVLGLSADHVYELLKQRFPPPAINKIRAVIGKVVSVVAWVNKAIDTTKSPAENARGMVGQAKEFGKGILTGIAEWVAGKVAEEVALMAASAAATAGLSEILDIARRIYKALVTAVRWANRILMMVNDALDHVLELAGGAIEPVGRIFLGLLQRGMPVVIGFLADQVGLGGIGAALRGIVDGIRKEVDAAILWLIDKIKAGLNWLIATAKAGVAAVVDWWKQRRPFTGADGKPHAIFFEGGENSAELMVASQKSRVVDYLNEVLKGGEDISVEVKDAASKALVLYGKIVDLTKATARERRDAEMPTLLDALSAAMQKIVGYGAGDLPADVVPDFRAPDHSTLKLVSVRSHRKGEEPAGDPPGWAMLQKLGLTKDSRWVRMHLITAGIGGVGAASNLVPAPGFVNTGSTVRSFERSVEALVSRKNTKTNKASVIWVNVRTESYHPAFKDEDQPDLAYDAKTFPRTISLKAGLHDPDPKNSVGWTENPTALLQNVVEVDSPLKNLNDERPNLNTATVRRLVNATGVDKEFAKKVIDVRSPRPFASVADFTKRMDARKPVNATDWDAMVGKVVAAIGGALRFEPA